MKKLISLAIVLVLALSFTAFAADFTCLSSTIENGAADVFVKEGTISMIFSDDINASTLTAVSMGVDGEPFEGFTATIGASNELLVTFGSDLAYSKTYEIYLSGLKSTTNVGLTGTNSLIFTTEAAPVVEIENIVLTKGIGSSVTEPANLEDDGTIQGFKVYLNNYAAEAKTVNIVCALYNGNGIIKRVLTSEKSIDATSTEMVELGTLIDSSYAGGFAKIYIWNNLSDKAPFVGSRTFNIQ